MILTTFGIGIGRLCRFSVSFIAIIQVLFRRWVVPPGVLPHVSTLGHCLAYLGSVSDLAFVLSSVLRYLDNVSGLVSFFGKFSYVSRLCLGPSVFLLAIVLGILAVFWTWSFPSGDFLTYIGCVSDQAFPSGDFLMHLRRASDLAFFFGRCSYVFRLSFGSGIFVQAIFLCT
jgi:hypothetical protein